MSIQKKICLAFSLLAWLAPLLAQQSVRPGINDHYKNADVDRWQGIFERDGREVWERRHEIVAALNLKFRMTGHLSQNAHKFCLSFD